MKLSQFARYIVPLYKTRVPVTLIGPPGIGKSDTVHTLPGILSAALGCDFGHVTVEAPTLDGPDVIGILVPVRDKDTGEAVARYTVPDIARQVAATGKDHGVLFIDEIGQADKSIQKALAPLFIEGKLGEYRIPKGWMVVSATNRAQDRTGVVKELSYFTNRQNQIQIEASIDDWSVWARNEGMHHMLLAFANFKPGVVMIQEVPARPGPYCSPRSYTSAAKFLRNIVDNDEDEIPNGSVVQAIVSGYIGEAASAELFSFLKVHQLLPLWGDIINNPETAKVPPIQRLDAAFAAAGLVIAKTDSSNINEAFTYCKRLPIELQTSVARTLVTAFDGVAFSSPAVNDFISEHTALIQSSID